ncbi:MAG: bifunctional nuclease family protein [Prosthecobacter sp.]|nr:bifunctional nuclease family protein [Prosthecobacter sp.]
MNREVIEAQVRAVLPLDGSFAVFLGNEEKTFVIYVDESVGSAISMFMRGVAKERPLTHDLLASVLLAFGARVDRVIINRVEGSVFYARIIVSAENELHARKVIELDARPSDSLALALQQSAPIFVAKSVWESVEDVSGTLAEIEKRSAEQAEKDQATQGVAAADLSEDDEDELDPEDLEDLDLEGILDVEDDDEEDEDEEDDEAKGYDDGYGGFDDDDDEGEEWKKGK